MEMLARYGPWQINRSAEGMYFHNERTGKSTWHVPMDLRHTPEVQMHQSQMSQAMPDIGGGAQKGMSRFWSSPALTGMTQAAMDSTVVAAEDLPLGVGLVAGMHAYAGGGPGNWMRHPGQAAAGANHVAANSIFTPLPMRLAASVADEFNETRARGGRLSNPLDYAEHGLMGVTHAFANGADVPLPLRLGAGVAEEFEHWIPGLEKPPEQQPEVGPKNIFQKFTRPVFKGVTHGLSNGLDVPLPLRALAGGLEDAQEFDWHNEAPEGGGPMSWLSRHRDAMFSGGTRVASRAPELGLGVRMAAGADYGIHKKSGGHLWDTRMSREEAMRQGIAGAAGAVANSADVGLAARLGAGAIGGYAGYGSEPMMAIPDVPTPSSEPWSWMRPRSRYGQGWSQTPPAPQPDPGGWTTPPPSTSPSPRTQPDPGGWTAPPASSSASPWTSGSTGPAWADMLSSGSGASTPAPWQTSSGMASSPATELPTPYPPSSPRGSRPRRPSRFWGQRAFQCAAR